jgi:xylulokinase
VVAAGTGDNMGAAVGLGLEPGIPVLSLGTSGTAFTVAERPAADPGGVVAGFADAGARYLPLACTLNATLAVDRVAGWLGLGREDVAPAGEVVVLPYLDGERTPDLPHAAASITGLRHGTTPGQILQATYEGALEALLSALDAIEAQTGPLVAGAPLVLVGGGARGAVWQATAARLAGRTVEVPEETDAVALGAAALAGQALGLGEAAELARGGGTRRGPAVAAPAHAPDEERLERIRRVREQLGALNAG